MAVELSDIRKKLISMVGPTSKVIETLSDVVSLSINTEDKSVLKVDIFDSIDHKILLTAMKRIIKKENIVHLDVTINKMPTLNEKGRVFELDAFIGRIVELETLEKVHNVSLSGGDNIEFKPFFLKQNKNISLVVDNFNIYVDFELSGFYSDVHITNCTIDSNNINLQCKKGILLEQNTFLKQTEIVLRSDESDNILQNNIFHNGSNILCYSPKGCSSISSTFLSQKPVLVQLNECGKVSNLVLDIKDKKVESTVRIIDCAASVITNDNGISVLETAGRRCDINLMCPNKSGKETTSKTKLDMSNSGKFTIAGDFESLTGEVSVNELIFVGGTITDILNLKSINKHTIMNGLTSLTNVKANLEIITTKYDEIRCSLPTGTINVNCSGQIIMSNKLPAINVKYDIQCASMIISNSDIDLVNIVVTTDDFRSESITGDNAELDINTHAFRCSDTSIGFIDIECTEPIHECKLTSKIVKIKLKGTQYKDSKLDIIADELNINIIDRTRINARVKKFVGSVIKNSIVKIEDEQMDPKTYISLVACKNTVLVTPYEKGTVSVSGSQRVLVLTQSYQQHNFIINDLITRLWVAFRNGDTLDPMTKQSMEQINAIELIENLDIGVINKFVGWNALNINNVETIK